MKIRVGLVGVVILLGLQSYGQGLVDYGFVVESNGDTVSGFIIKPNGNDKTFKYKENWNDKFQVRSHKDIMSFGVDGGYLYRSSEAINANGDIDAGFYEVLIESQISVYYFEDFYLHLDDSRFVKIDSRNKSTNISSILSGKCFLRLAQRISKLTNSKSEWTLLFRDYNDCLGANVTIYFYDRPKMNLGVGIGYAMINTSGADNTRPDLGVSTTSRAIESLIYFNSSIPGINEKIRLHLLASYVPGNSFLIDYMENNTFYETNIEVDVIQIETSIRYHRNVGGRCFFSSGIGFGIGAVNLKQKSRILETVEGNVVFTTDGSNEFLLSKKYLSLNGVAAFGYYLSPRKYLFLESKAGIGTKLMDIDRNNMILLNGRFGIGFSLN